MSKSIWQQMKCPLQLFFPSCRTKTVFYNLGSFSLNKGLDTVKRLYQAFVHQHILQIQVMKLVDNNSAPLLSPHNGALITACSWTWTKQQNWSLAHQTHSTLDWSPPPSKARQLNRWAAAKIIHSLQTTNKPVTSIHKHCQQRPTSSVNSERCLFLPLVVIFCLLLHRVNHLNKTSNTPPPKSSSVFLRPVSQTWTTEPPHR